MPGRDGRTGVGFGLRLLIAAVGAFGLAGAAQAQDTHYWTEQYGNRARLLGGAMIGSATDLSSVYYNPGRLALIGEPEILLAGNVFEYSVIKLSDQDSPQEITSSRFSISPSLFAGELRFNWLGTNRLAYSFLTRGYSELNAQGRFQTGATDFVDLPAAEFVADALRTDSRMSEYWAGLTWARPLTRRIGLGVSTFLAVRNQRGLAQRTTQILLQGDRSFVNVDTGEYRYDHWGLLWKIGLGTTLEDWDVGLTVTTPSVKLFGSGRVAGDASQFRAPGLTSTLVFIDQDGLSSTYNRPWAVGVGGSRRFGDSVVHLGIEWFGSVAPYTVLDAEPVEPLTGGAPVDPSFYGAADSVVNVAAGLSHRFSDTLEAYGSLRTDFSYAVDDGVANLSFTEWNLYHLAGGVTFTTGRNEFTTGAVLAFGSSDSPPLLEDQTAFDSSYFRVTAILGFSFGFADSPQPQ